MKSSFKETPVENVKKYWNENPCNATISNSLIGSKEYFNKIEEEKYSIEPHIPGFADFKKWKNKKVLEIGCGIGTDTINFARAGANVTAIDLSENSLAIAKQRAKIFELEDKIKFYCGSAEELTKIIPVEPYDLIYSFGVIHHTPHPEKVIAQIGNYAHPGTLIKIMLYYRFSWPVLWILIKGKGAFWKIDELIAKHSESQNCPITYTYSKKGIRNLFKEYNILDISIDCGISTANHLKKIRNNKLIYPILSFLEKPFGWHILVTAQKK